MWARSQAQGHGAGLWSWQLLPLKPPSALPLKLLFGWDREINTEGRICRVDFCGMAGLPEQHCLRARLCMLAGDQQGGTWGLSPLPQRRKAEGGLLGTHLGCQLLYADMCIILPYSHWPGVSRLGQAQSGRAPFMGTPSSTLGCRRARMAAVKSHVSCKQPLTHTTLSKQTQ